MASPTDFGIYKRSVILVDRDYIPYLDAAAMADPELSKLMTFRETDPLPFKIELEATMVMKKAKAELETLTAKVSVIKSLDLD